MSTGRALACGLRVDWKPKLAYATFLVADWQVTLPGADGMPAQILTVHLPIQSQLYIEDCEQQVLLQSLVDERGKDWGLNLGSMPIGRHSRCQRLLITGMKQTLLLLGKELIKAKQLLL